MTKPVHVVGVHEAKTQLSELLRRVECGEEIIIRRNRRPLARLVPFEPAATREFGSDAGAFAVPDDFNAPLPASLLDEFGA